MYMSIGSFILCPPPYTLKTMLFVRARDKRIRILHVQAVLFIFIIDICNL